MRAFVVAIVLMFLGGIGMVLMLGSHVTYTFLENNFAQVFREDPQERLTAEAYLIAHLETGEVVIEKNKDNTYPIASLVKLFTASIANDENLLERETIIVWQDFVTEGTAGSLWLGETYSVRDLLFPLLLSSSNDAAAALMRIIGTEAYASAKTNLLKDSGLQKTVLADSSGLNDANTSTASELAAFLKYAKHHQSYILDITTLTSYLGSHHGWINNNPGAAYENFRGGKHGYTYAAGRTFAGIFENNGIEYAVVLLGSDNLASDLEIMTGLLP